MTYGSGSSDVTGTAAQAWEARKGVCQDFSHIMVGALRSVGIAARYVSGYVLSKKDAEIGATNNVVSGELHVIVGTACGYSDVPV